MTKKGKITTGIVAGVVVLGGIGALTDKDTPNSLEYETSTSAIIEEVTEKAMTTTTGEEIKTTIAETTPITTTTEPETEATTPTTETSTTTEATTVTEATTIQATTTATPTSTTERENHFTDYNNAEQQNTTEYVLNTSSLKIHRPTCRDVKKIAHENYSTTTDFDKAISNGYTTCGHCF